MEMAQETNGLIAAAGTLEDWALAVLHKQDWVYSGDLPPVPLHTDAHWCAKPDIRPDRLLSLEPTRKKKPKSPTAQSLRSPERRAELFHTFLHHEVQAAELMCWAILTFVDAPIELRRGIARIVVEEARHAHLYLKYLEALGVSYGDFETRDWFWMRLPRVDNPIAFLATLGLGLEGANLDHAARFSLLLKAAGDLRGVEIQQTIGEEERAHVRFAFHWIRKLGVEPTFDWWRTVLPMPLSPALLKGTVVDVDARLAAGFSLEFVRALEAFRFEPRAHAVPH